MLSEQDETPRSKDRSATSDGMLSVDRDDERETVRDEQETERCRPAARPLRPKASHLYYVLTSVGVLLGPSEPWK